MVENSWLIPFKGRNSSCAYDQNFLWKHDSIYIMDNHRAALWCWLQHLPFENRAKLFHIDQHYDTLTSRIKEWVNNSPDYQKLSISEYLSTDYATENGRSQIVRYDNYLSLFFELYNKFIDCAIIATHLRDNDYCYCPPPDRPNTNLCNEIGITQLLSNLRHFLSENDSLWIMNLDIDFFFCRGIESDTQTMMFSDDYLKSIFQIIRDQYINGKIKVVTVALSPECCGGWKNAETVCKIFCDVMELDFKL